MKFTLNERARAIGRKSRGTPSLPMTISTPVCLLAPSLRTESELGIAPVFRNIRRKPRLRFPQDPLAVLLKLQNCRFKMSRSEEHTSELQSRLHLVCRLLLEKKKHIHLLHLLI